MIHVYKIIKLFLREEKIKRKLPESNILEYKIPWMESGIDPINSKGTLGLLKTKTSHITLV